VVSGGKETLSFEFIRILLRSQRARGLAARFASCWPVEGVNFVAAVAECGHSIGPVAAPNVLKRTNSPRCLVQRNGRRCSPFSLRKLQRLVHPKERRTSPESDLEVGPPFITPYAHTRSRASDATDLSCLACVLALSFRCWWLAVFSTALQDSCEPVNRLWFLLTAFACYA
jgi:hypothetical protein